MRGLANEILQWCIKNKMIINAKKMEEKVIKKYICGSFEANRKCQKYNDLKNKLQATRVYINSKLTWNTQIEKVRRKFTVHNTKLRNMKFLPS